MDSPARFRRIAPSGLSFGVEELRVVLAWAERQGLVMEVALDRVIDGAEFEEMLLLSARGRGRRHTMWRTARAVLTQSPGERPRAFLSLASALLALTPAQPPPRRWPRLGIPVRPPLSIPLRTFPTASPLPTTCRQSWSGESDGVCFRAPERSGLLWP